MKEKMWKYFSANSTENTLTYKMTWFMIAITKSIHPGDELCSFVSR